MFTLTFLALSSALNLSEEQRDPHNPYKFEFPRYENPITNAVTDVILNFYCKETMAVNIYQASSDALTYRQESDFMNEILYKAKSKVVVQIDGYKHLSFNGRMRAYNILFVDCFESFNKIFVQMSDKYFDYQGNSIIYVSQMYSILFLK